MTNKSVLEKLKPASSKEHDVRGAKKHVMIAEQFETSENYCSVLYLGAEKLGRFNPLCRYSEVIYEVFAMGLHRFSL